MPFSFSLRRRTSPRSLLRDDWTVRDFASVGVPLVLVLLILFAIWQRFDAEKASVRHNATVQQENIAAVISENLTQTLDRGRRLTLASEIAADGGRQAATNQLAALIASDATYVRVALYRNAPPCTFLALPSANGHDSTAVTHAVHGHPPCRTAKDVLLTRLLPGGEKLSRLPVVISTAYNDDALLAVLDLGHLLQPYPNLDLGRSAVIQILDDDGRALAEQHADGAFVIPDDRRYAQFANNTATKGSLAGNLFEGRSYLSSFQRLKRFPFTVVVSSELDEIMTPAQSGTRLRFLTTMTALTTMIGLAVFAFVWGISRQKRIIAALEAANHENRALIAGLEDEKRHAFVMAAHDHLTGLTNRRMFGELVGTHLSRAKRSREHYALLYLDLDRFKAINDTLGHHVGDLLLQTVADRLRSTLRESDIVARIGGDEFAVLLTGLASTDDVEVVAAKIVEQISAPILDLAGHDVHVTPSIGIAIFPRDGHDVGSLCRHADAAMYESKRTGHGKYTYYEPGFSGDRERLFALEQRLPRAIAENELMLHFQPKVRISDYRIIGFEALVRWQHPDFGLLYPGDFIPLAERTGLIVDLGNWVTESCCRQLATWMMEGLDTVPIAFNVSVQQLQDAELPQRIETLLGRYKVPAERLEVEITETTLVESIEIARQVLDGLEKLGIGIALDDFGSGFSNLSYIRTFPVHRIKIDREFINDIRNSPYDGAIVASIISLAHNLNMQVIAEGVETLDQLIHLKTAGCDEVQGYFFSRPVPASEATDLIVRSILVPAVMVPESSAPPPKPFPQEHGRKHDGETPAKHDECIVTEAQTQPLG
ncbi:EAL domain-containing protein [Azoarcus sp. DN11]|uniref:putative bifunctional diguanylate cyclase/phosphodiesterase n=1 Tax=Azoarcus sp. DN11 TaxID=356837 RepID=UPI0025705EB1|nr:EAL domain-containing protein [Azoarcus sp. DN11]